MTAPGTLFGYGIRSELPLARLRPPGTRRGELAIRASPAPLDAAGTDPVGRITWPDGRAFFTLGTRGAELMAWCALSGAYRIEPEAGIVWTDAPAAGPDWEDRVVNAIVPLLLSARGDLVLHAAAVAIGDRALLLCGPSGRGKSTLAHALDGRGAPVLSEDGIVLTGDGERVLAWPGPVGVRLHDGAAGKRLHPGRAAPLGAEPVAVGGIAVLGERGGAAVSVRPLDAAEALPRVFANAIVARRGERQRAFSRVAGVLGHVPVHEVRLPDDLGAVDASAAVVGDRLGAAAAVA